MVYASGRHWDWCLQIHNGDNLLLILWLGVFLQTQVYGNKRYGNCSVIFQSYLATVVWDPVFPKTSGDTAHCYDDLQLASRMQWYAASWQLDISRNIFVFNAVEGCVLLNVLWIRCFMNLDVSSKENVIKGTRGSRNLKLSYPCLEPPKF